MKRTIIASVIGALLCLPLSAQEESEGKKGQDDREFMTIMGNNRSGGMYGSFTVGYSEIDNDQAVLFGGRFMWVASHSIGFGFGGTGFINEYHYEPLVGEDVFLTGGYGGLYIEPILAPKFPVHLSFPCLFGAGGISYVTKDPENYINFIEDSEAFLIAEPGAEIELNITRNFRFALGVTYRFTTEFEVGNNQSPVVDSDALNGFTYMATFKFGRF
ncbi:MAG: hypothetical protein MUE32_07145 [Bacteroidales bacterium]|jgi:hypothetical protein|nr:hypothetical protein [Bacteroidales bacterium]